MHDKHARDRHFYSCPGAWYGTMPGGIPGTTRGHLTVDIAGVLEAIRYLRRHGYRITRTLPSTEPGGITLHLELRA